MSEKMTSYILGSRPHRRFHETTSYLMRDVIFALMPLVIFGVSYFGVRMLILMVMSVACCMALEALIGLILKKKLTLVDCSAAVTGIMICMILPVSVPFWIVLLADFIAIALVKHAFGGIGKNLFNPAAFAKVVLFFIFSGEVTAVVIGGVQVFTPLHYFDLGSMEMMPSLMSCFLGVVPGNMGETCSLLILLGGGYLMLRRVVDYAIPVSAVVSGLIVSLILGRGGLNDLFNGGMLFVIFFMAPDPVTSPLSRLSRVIYGVLLGILTVIFRITPMKEIAAYMALIIVNAVALVLDRIYTNIGSSATMMDDRSIDKE